MNQKRYGEPGQDVIESDIPPVFPGPDPSLTPKQRYDWAYERLIEAYRCPETQPVQRGAMLASIVENPVEDVRLMSAVYTALSDVELMGGSLPRGGNQPKEGAEEVLRARGSRAEACARKALKLNPADKVAPFCLFQALSIQERYFDVFEAIAQYNIDLESEEIPRSEFYEPAQFAGVMMGKPFWLTVVDLSFLKDACASPEGFERCFEIHLRYPKSFHYTRRLLQAAMIYPKLPTSPISVLCHNFARSISAEAVGTARYFGYLTVLLHNFTYLDDKLLMKKYLEELDELYPVYRETAGYKELLDYYSHRLGALNHLGRYEEAAAMAADIGSGYMDRSMLFNLMYSCVHLGRFDQAIQYGRAAASLGGDNMDLMYLGRAYLGSKDYAKAAETLKAAIWYIRQSTGSETYEFRDMVVTQVSFTSKEWDYMEAFKMLIQAYVGMEQYVEAEAAYRELRELVPDSHELSELRLMLTAQRDLIEKSGEVEKQCRRLKKELSASRNTVDEYVQRMKKWSDKLVKCQLLTNDEVSDELWESTVRDKMDEVLRIAAESEMASSGKFYERKLREVKKRFPKLPGSLQSYFATAEQLYVSFKGNTAIDFAPVLVEYCKVVEGALWEYLVKSPGYKARGSQWLDSSHGQKTLGSACAIVSSEWDKPLYIFERDLQKLKKLRNDSAHVGVDRVPDVEWVRTYLWQGDLLDELAQAGG